MAHEWVTSQKWGVGKKGLNTLDGVKPNNHQEVSGHARVYCVEYVDCNIR